MVEMPSFSVGPAITTALPSFTPPTCTAFRYLMSVTWFAPVAAIVANEDSQHQLLAQKSLLPNDSLRRRGSCAKPLRATRESTKENSSRLPRDAREAKAGSR